ncbi:MAG: epimerase [Phototrophicales bacterium]|nr:MAG: epimerase [Phototrophicales bacterium]
MTLSEHFLLTGALGFIGAWAARNLIREGVQVTIFDRATDPHRLKLIMTPDELAQIRFIEGDITDTESVERVVADGITHVLHLAALQVPFCKADPVMGARVNVVGTVNVFEAVKKAGLKHLAYASSIAVFGSSDEYDAAPLTDDAPLKPQTLYGVYKQANEGTARVYFQDAGISSIGLRPYTVYGVGRDQGLTSAPTKAMLAAASGHGYHIPFGGRSAYQYADDVAKIFIMAARAQHNRADVFNLRGSIAHMSEIVSAIEQVVPEVKGKITFDSQPLPFPEETDDSGLTSAIGTPPSKPLEEGVAETVALFRAALSDGRLRM